MKSYNAILFVYNCSLTRKKRLETDSFKAFFAFFTEGYLGLSQVPVNSYCSVVFSVLCFVGTNENSITCL
jgi:hypothetical protein